MAPSRRRMDGFSDDGLSYSVAGDFEKQMAQAMAEQEARTRKPRFVAGARVEEPDAPDLLQRELVDPVLAGFGFNTGGARNFSQAGRTAKPTAPRLRTFETESGDLVTVDQDSGNTRTDYKGDRERKLRDWKLGNLKAEAASIRSVLSDPFKSAAMGEAQKAEAIKRLEAIDAQASGLFASTGDYQTMATPPPDLIAPSGFIGAKGGENKFFDPAQVSQSSPAPIQQSSVEVVKPLKNGRKAVFNSNTKEFIRYAD